jgi:DNA replication initiation complex subunit (GINS family)
MSLKTYEIGYMLEDLKVRFLQDVKINIFDINIDAKRDDTIIIPRWLAQILKDTKLVEINEQDMSIELTRILSREKLTSIDQLTTIKPDFYIKINKFIQESKESDKEKLTIYLHDLIDIRLWKILNIARTTNLTPEFEQKLTIEEKILFNTMYKAINEFKNMVLR